MRSKDTRPFYFHADANTLGGFIEAPFERIIPPQASVSLAPVGGQAATRTEVFNFEEIVSCKAAYTRVSGRSLGIDGPRTMTASAVVEGLNILNTFTAKRLVAQVSVEYPKSGSDPKGGDNLKISFAGSSFEGLRLGGCDAPPQLSPELLCGAKTTIEYPTVRRVGGQQADKINKIIKDRPDSQWLSTRVGWMASDRELEEEQCVQASLVNGFEKPIPGETFGHVIEIPDFGRIFLGELIVCPASVQIFSFRVELGCGTQGQLGGPSAQVRGHPYP